MTTEADWEVLAELFADEHADFRHQIGLSRSEARAFYAPTAEAAAIRAEKEAILALPDANQYLVETTEGSEAFHEFVRLVLPEWTADEAPDPRAVTLALEPDWMLMASEPWRLVQASVCFPTRWSLAGKAGQSLASIHGVVPGLNASLGPKIERFFDRLAPGEGWGRANWGLSSNADRNQHPSLPYAPLSDRTGLAEVCVRVESQHLLKLPETRAMAFGIRILNFPLAEVAGRPEIIAGLKQRLRTMPADVADYKGVPSDFWRRL